MRTFLECSQKSEVFYHNTKLTLLHLLYDICYLPAGRSVLGKTVPEVLRTARGRRPRPRAQFFPIRTDLGRQITGLFFSLWKITL